VLLAQKAGARASSRLLAGAVSHGRPLLAVLAACDKPSGDDLYEVRCLVAW
jgi:hypothetical protein